MDRGYAPCMAWWIGNASYQRRAAIIIAVAFAHLVTLAAMLSHQFLPAEPAPRDALVIELADLLPEPDLPDRSVESAPPPQTKVVSAPPSDPVPPTAFVETTPPSQTLAETVPPAPSEAEPQSEPPSVLTQLDRSDLGLAQPDSTRNTADAGAAETVTPAQIANVLKQATCLKLKQNHEETCPKANPFIAAAGVAERAIPAERIFGDPRYVAKTVDDIVAEQEWAKLFHTPDSDLFADPEPPGAYNARRIRNGQEPLWSDEMRKGFRKPD